MLLFGNADFFLFFCIVHSIIHQKPVYMETQVKSVRAIINSLAVGDSENFPLDRYEYVVSCRTRLSTTTVKQFTSKIDREAQVVIITRLDDKPE